MLGDAPIVLARWLHFMCLAVALGASLFGFYAAPGKLVATFSFEGASGRIVRFCAYLALVTGFAWVACVIASIADGPAGLVDPGTLSAFFLETAFGPFWILKLALLLGLAVLAAITRGSERSVLRRGLVAVLAAGALACQAWLGHAAMATGGKLGVELASYIAHVLAVGSWIGSLVPLAFLSAECATASASPGAISAYSTILSRFSDAAMALVLVILITGIANATFRLGSASELVTTEYGDMILAKSALFALMLAIAAVNRWRLLPAASRLDARALRGLRRNIFAEQALSALVLLAAANLGILAP